MHIKTFFVLLLWFLLLGKQSSAQCPSASQFGMQWVDGAFSIAGTEVGTQCTGRAVVISTPATVANARYIYEYRNRADTAKATPSPNNTYASPGPYYIVQLGTVNGRPSMSCNLIQVYATSKPVFTLSSSCASNMVKLTVNTSGQIYGRYLIDWGDGKMPQEFLPGQAAPSYMYAASGTYQIKVSGEGTNALLGCNAASDPQTYVATNTSNPIANATATVQDNRFSRATIQLPDPAIRPRNYIFSKNGNEINLNFNTFIDSIATPAKNQVCYQLAYTDTCNRRPATMPTVCTIHVAIDGESLKWTDQSPFLGPVQSYIVEKIDERGQVLATYNDVGVATTWSADPKDIDQTIIYRITATAANGQTSISNSVKYSRTVTLFLPDSFSPNNDQINDTFELKGQSVTQGQLTIFDRWGNVLYYTDDWQKSWDGKDTQGRSVNNGYYAYQIYYTDMKKNTYRKEGTVYVLK